ncbi:MAG: hypothetical protein EOO28_17945 [Comamonadaceae bacterium]|nr:MAG: hypothetical protein EOO28_17945 [Comamonadaceae bacterium]
MFSQSSRPSVDALQVLQSALKTSGVPRLVKPRLLVAGAGGVLGNEVLRRLAGSGRFAHAELLACEPMTAALSQVSMAQVGPGPIAGWPVRLLPAQVGLVMFEPPRLYYERERALWTPTPEQLLPLARWFRLCGVDTLVVVTPHDQGRLPEALKRGLANLDEQALTGLGFDRLLLVRSARKAEADAAGGFLEKTAAWMLSIFKYMIPANEQPVRPARLAEFIDEALRVLPPGNHVAPQELLGIAPGQSGARDMKEVVRNWLHLRAGAPLPGDVAPASGSQPN